MTIEPVNLPLIVGELNPYGGDDEFALYPAPDGCSGHRLCCLILAIRRPVYMRVFDRCNLCEGKWNAKDARARAAELIVSGRKLVLLGAKVANAFGVEFRPFTLPTISLRHQVPIEAVILPHPSGLCRIWSEPDAFKRAREAVGLLVPELVPMMGVAAKTELQTFEG